MSFPIASYLGTRTAVCRRNSLRKPLIVLGLFVTLATGCRPFEPHETLSQGTWANEGQGVVAAWHRYESKQAFMNSVTRNHQHRLMTAPSPAGPFSPLTEILEGPPPAQLFYMKSAGYVLSSDYCKQSKTCLKRYALTSGAVEATLEIDTAYDANECASHHHVSALMMNHLIVPSPDGSTVAVFRSESGGGCADMSAYKVTVQLRDASDLSVQKPAIDVSIPAAAMKQLNLPAGCSQPDTDCLPRKEIALGAQGAWMADNRFVVAFFKPLKLGTGDGATLTFWPTTDEDPTVVGAIAIDKAGNQTPVQSVDFSCLEPATSSSSWSKTGLWLQPNGSASGFSTFAEDRFFGCQ